MSIAKAKAKITVNLNLEPAVAESLVIEADRMNITVTSLLRLIIAEWQVRKAGLSDVG